MCVAIIWTFRRREIYVNVLWVNLMEMFNILCNLNENEMLEFIDLTTGQYLFWPLTYHSKEAWEEIVWDYFFY